MVFTSDHGEAFGEHGLFLHGGSFHDELLRVPLIVAGPGIAQGKRVRTPVSLVDIMPTLRDLMGLESVSDVQGHSLEVLLRAEGTAEVRDRPHYPHYLASPVRPSAGIDAWVDGRYKLIAKQEDRWELYDLAEDPGELSNLAAERPVVVSRMRADLERVRSDNAARRRRNFETRTQKDRQDVHEQALEGLRELGYIE